MTVYFILLGLAAIIGLIAFVCQIMVWVKIFKNAGVGLGILAIFCAPFTLIYGWIKAKPWNMVKLMAAYTLTLIIAVVLYTGATIAMVSSPEFKAKMQEIQDQNQQQPALPAPQN